MRRHSPGQHWPYLRQVSLRSAVNPSNCRPRTWNRGATLRQSLRPPGRELRSGWYPASSAWSCWVSQRPGTCWLVLRSVSSRSPRLSPKPPTLQPHRFPQQAMAPQTAGRSAAQVAAKSTPRRSVAGSVEVLLDKADTAFRDRRYVEPETDSALLYYQSVLAQAPDNGEARQGVDRIVAVLDQRLQSAVAERRFDDAETALAQLERVRPSDPMIQSVEIRILEGQIAEALQAGRFDRANQVLRQATQAQALPADRATYWRDEIGREISRRQRAQQAAIAQKQAAEEVRPSAEMRAAGTTPGTRVDAGQQAPAFGEVTETPRPSPNPGARPQRASPQPKPPAWNRSGPARPLRRRRCPRPPRWRPCPSCDVARHSSARTTWPRPIREALKNKG